MTAPFPQVAQWLADAKACAEIIEPTAMSLATATIMGKPSVRIVLLKEFDARGFVFYTNLESRKGHELAENAQAAMCFHWAPLHRQLRAEGRVELVSDAEADSYFHSRPRISQLGAWASQQSAPLASPEMLPARVKEVEARHEGSDVPRPPHWHGFRLVPQLIEFWQEGDFRLHRRDLYVKQAGEWRSGHLFP